jgi:heme exporter protein A
MPDDHTLLRTDCRLAATDLAAIRGGREVFAGISFSLAAGEVMVVTGPNGSGKSTLLRVLAGLLDAAGGTVALHPASDAGIGARLHYLGHLDALKPGLTVRQNLRFWSDLWHAGADVEAALAEVGLAALAGLRVSVLSAGQRRRAALARLLVAQRPLWLLDEPATALDAAGETLLGGLIGRHLASGGMAVIATHIALPLKPAHTLSLGPA